MQAAQRRAIAELLFFSSLGDLRRCERICRLWNLKACHRFRGYATFRSRFCKYRQQTLLLLQVSDPNCCDYDKRTPL